jgi:hypothetical protein
MLAQFDSIKYEHNGNPNVYNYAYLRANFSKSIKSALLDTMNRIKDCTYMNLRYDEFFIDDRELKIESLHFKNNKLNKTYIKLLDLHKNSIEAGDPPPPLKNY